MNAKPILFSAPMIRALLEGRKTQTRRIIESQPKVSDEEAKVLPAAWDAGFVDVKCPYGEPGDLLWVKESWRVPSILDDLSGKQIADKAVDAGYRLPWCPIKYDADGTLNSVKAWSEFGFTLNSAVPGRYRHARFMPRWASRITLKIKKIRVERLQDIIEQDAQAEGCGAIVDYAVGRTYRTEFQELWRSIHGPESWQQNPWLWVIEFEVIKQNIDAVLKAAA